MSRIVAFLLVLLILIGCNQSDNNSNSESIENKTETQSKSKQEFSNTDDTESQSAIIARVNDKPIYEDDLNGQSLDLAITEEILYQDGIGQNLDKQFEDQVRKYEKRLIIRYLKNTILEDSEITKPVSEEEVEQYYDLNRDRYSYVSIQEITAPDANVSMEIKKKAENREDLLKISQDYPEITIQINELGYDRGKLKYFDTLEVGKISEVIQKEDGSFAVYKIVEIKDMPISNVRSAIKSILEARRKAHIIDNYAQKVAYENDMKIEILQK